MLGILLTKLINENKMDWDEHLPTILFSYKTSDKVGTRYTSYQLVYRSITSFNAYKIYIISNK